ncbi:hypothetical protein P7L66_13110 [Tistrella mobilis]|uniref:transcriptional regulator n=1 Tax=Tistrella mobilis TaxID=171437 RepID=UPI00355652BF
MGKRGPKKGTPQPGTDHVGTAMAAWGRDLPDWVRALASAAQTRTANAVAYQIRYDPMVVHRVLRRTYDGSYARVEAAVRGLIIQAVDCPVLGRIDETRCRRIRTDPRPPTSSHLAIQTWRACKTCLYGVAATGGRK